MRRSTFSPQLDPPVPVDGFYDPVFEAGWVDFDKPLNPASLDLANWFVRHSNVERDIWFAAVTPPGLNRVGLRGTAGAPNIGPDVVSYSPPPFDVTAGPRRVPAAAFADFPIT